MKTNLADGRERFPRVRRVLLSLGILGIGALVPVVGVRFVKPAMELTVPTASADRRPVEPAVVRAEGRVVTYPNGSVVLGTELGGRITAFHVTDQDTVKKGALIAELDGSDQQAALAEARARIHEADVSIAFLRSEVVRTKQLLDANAVAKSALDKQRHELDAAVARRNVAAAMAGRLRVSVGKTKVTAPLDGVVMDRHAEPGETVAPGARLVTIADTTHLRVEAEVDEFDAPRITLGAPVTLTAEGHAGSWAGVVEDIPAAVTGRRLKPQDPARPADARVLLVKVALSGPTPLRLGQRVDVAIGK